MEKKHVSYKSDSCCGCSACASVCPKSAISMETDEKGFLCPKVDDSKCVECGLCLKVCEFNKEAHFYYSEKPLAAYGIKHKNEKVRANSRSGGVFTVITDYIIDNGGCVFGASLDPDFVVRHVKSNTKEERNRLRGSKYVQSEMGNVFKEVENELKTGRLVAFSGTACQVAGLQSFLRKEYENLFTFDIVCHGVPSPKVFSDYIQYLREKYGDISGFDFRDKSILGWDMHFESFITHGNKKVSRDYSRLFYSHYPLRPSCFDCKYANMHRPGDFSLADFWGVNKHFEGFNDNKGVSLLFANSDKALALMDKEEILYNIDYRKCETLDFVHPNLKHPTARPEDYDEFWDYYNNHGFKASIYKYCNGDFISRFKRFKPIAIIYLKRKVLKTERY